MMLRSLRFILAVTISANLFSVSLHAAEKKPINVGTVRTLSFLPLNSPAFFVAKKPVAGVVTTLTEGLGITSIVVGTMALASKDVPNCSFVCDITDTMAGMTLAGGIALWLPSFIYTAVKAPQAAEKYNSNLANAKSMLKMAPIAFVTNGGGALGLAGTF